MKHGIMICGAKSSPNNNKTEVTKLATYWKWSNTKKKKKTKKKQKKKQQQKKKK